MTTAAGLVSGAHRTGDFSDDTGSPSVGGGVRDAAARVTGSGAAAACRNRTTVCLQGGTRIDFGEVSGLLADIGG
jgi:hypothetical protein